MSIQRQDVSEALRGDLIDPGVIPHLVEEIINVTVVFIWLHMKIHQQPVLLSFSPRLQIGKRLAWLC